MKKSSKGVSPLIATVILVAVVVSIAGAMMGWFSGYIKSTQERTENKTFTAVDCSGAIISIEDVFLANGTSGSAKAIVKNIGVVEGLTLTDAVLFNVTGGNFSASNMPIADFRRGDIKTITFDNINVPDCGNFSRVVVTTNCPEASAKYAKTPVC